MTTLQLLELTDDTSYLILLQRHPTLLDSIEATLTAGATAAMIEAWVFQKYGPASLMAGIVAGAAHHIEKWHLAGWEL